ncbi:MAG TPA: amidohydrolase family protein [Dehalococcoidia bacterium]|nr:amidohydrolase family protein [Dehalococcoidia bacterium]
MNGIIDADTHVIESEEIWGYFDPALAGKKPALVAFPDPSTGTTTHRWVIDGKLFPKPHGKGGVFLATPPMDAKQAVDLDWACRSLNDTTTRIQHKDRMGVQTQVVYPTLFLAYLTDDQALDIALARSYNRFLAHAWAESVNQLRWVVVPPLQSIDASIEELNYGKQNGAVGVFFRGMEGERSLADPYFFPLYAEAERLDMPVCVHTGAGAPALTEMCDSRLTAAFSHIRLLPLMAFHDLVYNRVPEQFPALRFGFIEAAASWMPFLLHFLRRRIRMEKRSTEQLGPKLCREYRMFVACEADEDIPYLLNHIGKANLLIGSDYGHHDQSAQPDLVSYIQAREDVPPAVVDKILRENPRRFYAIA